MCELAQYPIILITDGVVRRQNHRVGPRVHHAGTGTHVCDGPADGNCPGVADNQAWCFDVFDGQVGRGQQNRGSKDIVSLLLFGLIATSIGHKEQVSVPVRRIRHDDITCDAVALSAGERCPVAGPLGCRKRITRVKHRVAGDVDMVEPAGHRFRRADVRHGP